MKPEWQRDPKVRGLYLRSFKSGKSSYAVRKRIGSRVLTITLGDVESLSLEDARKRAVEALEGHRTERKTATLRGIQKRYLEARALKPASITSMNLSVSAHFSDWLDKPIVEITRAMIEERMKRVAVVAAKRSRSRLANERGQGAQAKAGRYLKALFNFALIEEEIEKDPTLVIKSKKMVKCLKRRRSYILPSQREAFRMAVETSEVGDLVKVLIATGLRLGEALSLKWEQVNIADRLLVIGDTKNGIPFLLPYPNTVQEVLERIKRDSGPVFRWKDGKPIKNPYKHFSEITEKCGVVFSPHDLRRTWATMADALEIPREVIKLCLNHKLSDVTEGYIIRSPERLRKVFQAVDNHWRTDEAHPGEDRRSSESQEGGDDVIRHQGEVRYLSPNSLQVA